MSGKNTLKYWKIGLGVSLALNFLILGLIGGAVMNGSKVRSSASGLRGDTMFTLTAMLPRSEREALRDRTRESARSGTGGRMEHLKALVEELRRPDFSQDRFAGLMKQGRDARSAGALQAERALAERLAELSPKERLEYADRLTRVAKRRPKQKR